ncbi:pirin family protein [Nonomuraea africana]|uniref:Redox-sensitive bicupin YhaK (Pirin superfamily) n=1 Tax=Nonomuraea africana TaxID=46171 RepID=A0ABR9KC39_9ACTN|nr:pirin family protein [Nonomuraea africana]MBE1559569.1 redox-sensitive bicupin YhaK (pirin superfamily) [Nonomuraea africana]
MSNVEQDPRELVCAAGEPVRELVTGHQVALGGPRAMTVTRTLPAVGRRMVGAWCFVDHYGPETTAMSVPPHPHTGLQTVTWLVSGEVVHRDSLGSLQLVRPGQLNLMTAGRGISHSERSPEMELHGVQLWVALPDHARQVPPGFEHHADLPVARGASYEATVLMGAFDGVRSPAGAYTPLVGAEVSVDGLAELPLAPGFEHAVLTLTGSLTVDETALPVGPLLYLGQGRSSVPVSGRGRLLLIGGEPFEEQIVMWWNFVGRSHEEIEAFRKEWSEGALFGTVADGDPLPAPALPTARLKPRGRVR